MFNVACKDPFEAEKIGQRRARKIKESNEAIDGINDALSNLSVSGRTTETSGVFSSTSSSTSSRTSIIGIGSTADSVSVRTTPALLEGFGGRRDRPASSKRTTSRNRFPRSLQADSGTNPFASHINDSNKYTDHGEDWKHGVANHPNLWTLSQGPSRRPPSRSEAELTTLYVTPAQISTASGGPALDPNNNADSFARFQRLLRKIEMVNDHAFSSRLAEQWPEDDHDEGMRREFDFETTLYALVKAQKLSTPKDKVKPNENINTFPIPSALDRGDAERLAGANILHLGTVVGSPEAWYISTKHPQAIVHSVGCSPLPFDLSSSTFGRPPNLQLESWAESPRLDYVDSIFDVAIITHHLFSQIKCTFWPVLIDELSRVLAPGGLLVVSTMDALPIRSGQALDAWTHQNLTVNVLRRFMVPQPSLLLPSWVEEDGRFHPEMIERTQFDCMMATGQDIPSTQEETQRPAGNENRKRRKSYTSALPMERLARVNEEPEHQPHKTSTMTWRNPQDLAASRAGWRLYERLYASFLPESTTIDDRCRETGLMRTWWTQNETVLGECQRCHPCFEMVTFVYRRVQI